jgi:hypothetical protein
MCKNYGIFDFCIGVKAKNGYWYETEDGNKVEGKVLRYFVSNEGEHVLKTNGTRISKIEAHPQKDEKYLVTIFNKFEEKEDYNINYNYYITEANKLIKSIEDD